MYTIKKKQNKYIINISHIIATRNKHSPNFSWGGHLKVLRTARFSWWSRQNNRISFASHQHIQGSMIYSRNSIIEINVSISIHSESISITRTQLKKVIRQRREQINIKFVHSVHSLQRQTIRQYQMNYWVGFESLTSSNLHFEMKETMNVKKEIIKIWALISLYFFVNYFLYFFF